MNDEMLCEITSSLEQAMQLGETNENIRKLAREFMLNNYPCINEETKTMAIEELERNENLQKNYPQSLITAFEMAIATLFNDMKGRKMVDLSKIRKCDIREYITNHGQGPNTYPEDGLVMTQALPNGKTRLTYCRALTADELNEYDIKPEWEA